jgi:hypothetical protein
MLIYLNKLPVCSGECVTDIKIVYQGKMKTFFTHLAKHAPMKDLFSQSAMLDVHKQSLI